MDLERNHGGTSLDSLFHLDTLFLQQSAQMEMQGQREPRDICLQWHSSVSFLHLSRPGKSLSLWKRVHMHVRTRAHTHTWAIVSLTFCSLAAAAAGQVVINSKYTSCSAQLMLSHSSSIRHLSTENDKCTAKNLLSCGKIMAINIMYCDRTSECGNSDNILSFFNPTESEAEPWT